MRSSPPPEILGKTITGIIIKHNVRDHSPYHMIHIVFHDGTSLEIDLINEAHFGSYLDQGGQAWARQYMGAVMQVDYEAYLDENGAVVNFIT
jgi:hypothetical protein